MKLKIMVVGAIAGALLPLSAAGAAPPPPEVMPKNLWEGEPCGLHGSSFGKGARVGFGRAPMNEWCVPVG